MYLILLAKVRPQLGKQREKYFLFMNKIRKTGFSEPQLTQDQPGIYMFLILEVLKNCLVWVFLLLLLVWGLHTKKPYLGGGRTQKKNENRVLPRDSV